jgi:two-component system LytT family response regulator
MTERDVTRILVVDDEPLARIGVRHLLKDVAEGAEIFEASNGEEAIRAIREHRPDLVFLDVQLPKVDGFGVIEAIGAARMPPTILVTAYDEYALKAFEAQAVDYLLKPIDPDRFRDAYDRATRRAERGEVAELRRALASLTLLVQRSGPSATEGAAAPRIHVRQEGRVILLDPREILWIESVGNYVTIHARTGSVRHRATLTEMEASLGDGFVRIRRSTLVRVDAVRYCEPYGKGSFVIVLHDKTKLISSRYFRAGLAPLLGG